MRTFLAAVFLATSSVWASPISEWMAKAPAERGPVPDVALTKEEAGELRDQLGTEVLADLASQRADEVKNMSITIGDKTMKWLEKEFGHAAAGKRSLWISLHGGGTGPAAMNDQQWQNQIRLYKLKEGIYIAPRAPDNAWNMWHLGYMDPLFDRLITDMIATRGVDPNRVFIMGYSAGGDGVWQLAPRLADRFAAAAMMAGHPGDASLLPLRNLPFAIFVGGNDAAYNRNKLDEEKGKELDELEKADEGGYEHMVRVYKGLPHWMNGKDAEAVPWMAKHTRNPWPKKVIWVQDDVTHDRFYWLEIPADKAKVGEKIIATVSGNTIALEGDVPAGCKLNLSDALVDLDAEVTVTVNGKSKFSGMAKRTPETIIHSLKNLPDPSRCAFAVVQLN
ncbi:dienelactone hydrolase family protein [Luteolibacter pohnpeiensis]|uniref:Dienelactone hydrolase family protein n=1 Tax=Luteolibacter pohnpeiensis TaxID=454153 RepID=A0A934S508_9BACT|nr:dienelactone hydrolase family protein [Luteolibacter pohnpeiensis]MBK1882671.1 dienelactone hydrolase family protein [Luteolibacter pohnpeiensis]